MHLNYLVNEIPWFGSHTGYEKLPFHLKETEDRIRVFGPKEDLLSRALGKAVSAWRGHGKVNQSNAYARARVEIAMRRHPGDLAHLIYGETHFLYWRDVSRAIRRRTVLTFHQPPSTWSQTTAEALESCSHAIVLWQRDLDWFRSKMQGKEVHFIPHPVDTEFFTPGPLNYDPMSPLHLLYAGVHLRNTEMLGRIIRALSKSRSDLHFDLLVPVERRSAPGLSDLRGHPQVSWHANLSDEKLRDLYRKAYLLLLPMNQSGANTAVIEALACGLPIVTTDVGGIRDYGGGDVFPIVANDDDDGMISLIEEYLMKFAWRQEVGAACRLFAERTLAWPIIVEKHRAVYRRMSV